MAKRIIVMTGPTAVGKTKHSIEIAEKLNGEIVSADSMQIYKYMDIGSAKPDKEELARVRHHLVGEIDPGLPFSVASYRKLAKSAIADIFARKKQPIIAGGTGLYINSLIYDMDFSSPPVDNGYRRELEELARMEGNECVHKRLAEKDAAAAERIHPNNLRKMIRALEVAENSENRIKSFENSFVKTEDYGTCLICLTRNREELYDRINKRVDLLIKQGLIGEVQSLLNRGLGFGDISMKGIGYKEIIRHFSGEFEVSEAVSIIKRNTRRYAKRQLTWFRRYEDMKWFNLSEYEREPECKPGPESVFRGAFGNIENNDKNNVTTNENNDKKMINDILAWIHKDG